MGSEVRLQPQMYDRLLEAIEQVYNIENPDEFLLNLPILKRLVCSDYVALTELSTPGSILSGPSLGDGRVIQATQYPSSATVPPRLISAFSEYVHQHPSIAHFEKNRDGRPYRLSDFIKKSNFHRLELYNEYYRNVKVESQIYFFLDLEKDRLSVINLNRKRGDFSEEDKLLLSLIRPHLVRAYRNVTILARCRRERELLETAIDQEDRGVILVGLDGIIQSATSLACSLLWRYFDTCIKKRNRLPPLMQKWLGDIEGADMTASIPALTNRKGNKSLLSRAFFESGADSLVLLLKEMDVHSPFPCEIARISSLTDQENNVLYWLTLGKTNQDISYILGIKRATVKKHLENTYRKLGVETRTAAALVYLSSSKHLAKVG